MRQRIAIEERRRKLKSAVQFWLSGQTGWLVDSYEINYAIADAPVIAKADGLDVVKLSRIFEQMKKVVRKARFEDPQIGPPPDEDERLSAYFSRLFTFAHNVELESAQSTYARSLMESSKWYGRELATGLQEVCLDIARRSLGAENTDALLRAAASRLDEAYRMANKLLQALADDPEYVHPGKDKWFIHQKLRQAAQDKIDLDALPRELRGRAAADAMRVFQEGLGAVQSGLTREQRVALSGIVPAHAEALAHVAKKRDEYLLMRYVNPDATPLIARDAATKWMDIKAKSAVEQVIAGVIPIEQSLNKAGSEMRRVQASLRAAEASDDAAAIAAWRKKLAQAQENVAKDRACMQNWCRTRGPDGRRRCDPSRVCPTMERAARCIPIDRERLAKDYYHLLYTLDVNLDPNPNWKWGPRNALGGWLPPYSDLQAGAERSAAR